MAGDGRRPRGGALARRSSRSPPPTSPRPRRSRAATQRGHRPRCRPRTIVGDGCRRSSNNRRTPAGRATATPSEFATTPRRPPDGGHSTGEPDEASDPATKAPTGPIPGRSGRDDHAHLVPTSTRPKRYAGHALIVSSWDVRICRSLDSSTVVPAGHCVRGVGPGTSGP
jgi:hypothetical protein